MRGNILLSVLIGVFLLGGLYLLGSATVAKATPPTHKQWSVTQWTDWSECEPVAECGTDEGTQYRQSYRVCSFHPGGHADCNLGDILWLQTQERSCEVETPACIEDVCDNLEGVQEETPEGYLNDEGYCYIPEPEPTPTPEQPGQPGLEADHTSSKSDAGTPPSPNQCVEGEQAPATPILGQLVRLDGDTVFIGWQRASDVDHYIIQYGKSYSDMPYGLPYVNGDSVGVDLDGVWSDGHVFGRLIAEGSNNCQSSVLFDP